MSQICIKIKKNPETDNIKTITKMFLVASKQSVEPDESVETVLFHPEQVRELDDNVPVLSDEVTDKYKDLDSKPVRRQYSRCVDARRLRT